MKFFKWLLRTFLVLLLIITGLATYIVATQSGLQTLLALAEKVLPGTLSYERIEGRLIGPLDLQGIRYQDTLSSLDFQLRQAQFNWQPRALLNGQILVNHLNADGITVRLPEPAAEEPVSEPFELPDVHLPVDITVDELRINDVHIFQYQSEQPIIVSAVHLQAETVADDVRLEELQITTPEAELKVAGQITPAEGYPVALDLSWAFQDERIGNLQGSGQLTGEVRTKLTIKHQTHGVVNTILTGDVSDVFSNPQWHMDLDMTIAELGQFVADLTGASLQGELSTRGTLDDFRLMSEIDTQVPQLGPVTFVVETEGNTRALRINQLKIAAAESPLSLIVDADIDIDQQIVEASGRWQELNWPPAGPAQVSSPNGEFNLSGTLQDYRLDLSTRIAIAEFGTLDLSAAATGSDKAVRINELTINSPADAELLLTTSGELEFASLEISAESDWRNLSWPLNNTPQVIIPQGKLAVSGSPKAYQLELTTLVDGPQLAPLNASIIANGTDQSLTVSKLSVQASEGELVIDARAEVSFVDLGFDANGQWTGLAWPLQGIPQVESPKGHFTASGNLKDYIFTVDASVQGENIPQGDWLLEGQGSDQALKKLDLQGKTLAGEIEGDISATWQPSISWQIMLNGITIDPGTQWPEIPGNLNFKLETQGHLGINPIADSENYIDYALPHNDQALNASLKLIDLSGTLSNQKVQGQAQLMVSDQNIDIQSLQLQAGTAGIRAAGYIKDSFDLNWDIQIPSLQGLVPNASGAIAGTGRLTGSRSQPRADAELSMSKLSYGENKIQDLKTRFSIDLGGKTTSTAQILGRDIQAAGQTVQSISLTGQGVPAKHAVKLEAKSDLGQVVISLAGELINDAWQGAFDQLNLLDTIAGDWRLEKPMPLSLSKEQIVTEQGCLASAPSRLCILGEWSSESGADAKVTLQDFNLSRFREFLPPDMSIDNSLNIDATAKTGPQNALQVDIDSRLSPGNLSVTTQGRQIEIDLQESFLRASTDGQNANAQLEFNLGSLGQLEGDVKLNDLTGQRVVAGTIRSEITELELISAFAPQLQNVAGQLLADLNLSGALPTPVLSGNVSLQNAAAEIPQAGINVQAIEVALTSDGNGPLRLSGSAQSGSGILNLTGEIEPFERQLNIVIQGKDFQAMGSPEIQAIISPDMQIELDKNRVNVNGSVTIPKAYISPPGGSEGGIITSNDVVIVSETEDETTIAQAGIDIFAKVQVILGNDVQVEAAGFKGLLQGDLTIEQTPQLAPRGTGNIQVAAGDYKIYGQDLAIERGRVLFSGGPIDNPGLDLRVSRTYSEEEEITVGAQVGGTLKTPTLQLFSQPAMPDSSIISYLVFGRAPNTSSETENAMLYQAAAALAATGSSSAVKNISDTLGLDELSFDGGESLDDAALVIGKYLSPDLYISFGIGLFEAAETFNLRYKINKRLSFESSTSSTQSSADLIYTIKR